MKERKNHLRILRRMDMKIDTKTQRRIEQQLYKYIERMPVGELLKRSSSEEGYTIYSVCPKEVQGFSYKVYGRETTEKKEYGFYLTAWDCDAVIFSKIDDLPWRMIQEILEPIRLEEERKKEEERLKKLEKMDQLERVRLEAILNGEDPKKPRTLAQPGLSTGDSRNYFDPSQSDLERRDYEWEMGR